MQCKYGVSRGQYALKLERMLSSGVGGRDHG
ncbi:MAG: hypothetical protein ACK6DF_07685 [Betaproteobacteria bacterium]